MPCYLFSYHGYGTWLPDRPRGYVRRDEGVLPPDEGMAELYRHNMKHPAVTFDHEIQRHLIAAAIEACNYQKLKCSYIATEPTHVHILVSWTIDRTWEVARAKLRESLSRHLNRKLERREWFSKSPSRKRVRDRKHFDYLTTDYLRKHSGWKWSEESGFFL
jgi:hypothetical protein